MKGRSTERATFATSDWPDTEDGQLSRGVQLFKVNYRKLITTDQYLAYQQGVVVIPGEALLDELSVKRPIPDAAGVALPVERRLEAPDVRDSTMVPSAEAWRRSKMALLKRG